MRLPVFLMFLVTACAFPSRDSAVDPANTPVIEVSDPVLDADGVLISWRYVIEGTDIKRFLVRKVATTGDGTRFPSDVILEPNLQNTSPVFRPNDNIAVVGSTDVTSGSEWQSASIRDPDPATGITLLYQIAAINSDGLVSVAQTTSIRID